MQYFKKMLHPKLQEPEENHSIEELTSHFKCKVAWISWHESLNKKITLPKNTSKTNNTWSDFDNVNISYQRFSYFAQLDTEFSKDPAKSKVKEQAQNYLDASKCSKQELIKMWRLEISKLKKDCTVIEDRLKKSSLNLCKIGRPIVSMTVSQPSYVFASHCFTSVSNITNKDARLTLDETYFNVFKNLSGLMVLTLELSLYSLTSPTYGKVMLIQALLCSEYVLGAIYNYSEKKFPGKELSILSSFKSHVSNIGTMIYFIQYFASSSLSYESFVKFSTMTLILLAFNKISELYSSLFGRIMSRYDKIDHVLLQNLTTQMLQLAAFTYLYPWILEAMDNQLLAQPDRNKALKTLGIAQDATPEEIKVKIKQLIKELHPDLNKGEDAAKRIREVLEAKAVLKM